MPNPVRICPLVAVLDRKNPKTKITRESFSESCRLHQWHGMGNKLRNRPCVGCGIGRRVNKGMTITRPPAGIEFITKTDFDELKHKVDIDAARERLKLYEKLMLQPPSFSFARLGR